MRVEDAPPAGWYPDPEGYSRLRWWEGTDWSDRFRAPPTPSESDLRGQTYGYTANGDSNPVAYDQYGSRVGGISRQESEAMINQVRMAAREEAERAAAMFGAQARAATRNITPLISQYTNKLIKWIRILSVIAIVLVVGWIAFQIFAQVSMFEWIGDRIDNLGDNSGSLYRSP
ncbi:MAG TPA: DUF2510 domain-containing protein [Ilumatobacter sp.]|nr:DUF2510 domain-containing protein [Ilumatobacter sp.]